MYYCELQIPPPPKLKAQIAYPFLFIDINAKYISRTHDYEVDLYNANTILLFLVHFPHFVMHFHVVLYTFWLKLGHILVLK